MSAFRRLERRPWAGYLVGAAGVAVVTGGLLALDRGADVLSLAVCYQLVVLVVSGAFGAGPGLATSLASVLAFNWYFVPPTGSLSIADASNLISLGVFAATAPITSQLAAGFRRQRAEADASGWCAAARARPGARAPSWTWS